MKKIIIAFFLLWNVAFSQTRLWLTSVLAPSTTGPVVTTSSFWTYNVSLPASQGGMRSLTQYEAGNEVSAYLVTTVPTTSVQTVLLRKCFTPPLATQTLNCTITGQFLWRALSGSSNKGIILLRLVNPDGSIAQEIDSISTALVPNVPGYINRGINYTLTNLNITSGQRLLFEIGMRIFVGGQAGIYKGNLVTNADLPVDNTTTGTATLNPWLQFSQTIKFMPLGINF